MVMVVADPILEPRRGPGGLNAADEAFGHQDAERVVNRLQRDRADLGPHGLSDSVGSDVRLSRYRPQNSQSLRRHLDAAAPKKISRVSDHTTC